MSDLQWSEEQLERARAQNAPIYEIRRLARFENMRENLPASYARKIRLKAIWCLIWHKRTKHGRSEKCRRCGMYFRDGAE